MLFRYPSRVLDGDVGSVLVRYRPEKLSDTGRLIQLDGYLIRNGRNQQGFYITCGFSIGGQQTSFAGVEITNSRLENFRCTDGTTHMDHILINGGYSPARITLQDIEIDGGDDRTMPILCQGGLFSTITLRRVQVKNCVRSVTIDCGGTSKCDTVLIEQCPGLQVFLMGSPGNYGSVTVRCSPGAKVVRAYKYPWGTPDVPVLYEQPVAPCGDCGRLQMP